MYIKIGIQQFYVNMKINYNCIQYGTYLLHQSS